MELKSIALNGTGMLIPSIPVTIITGWHATWLLYRYTDQKRSKTAIIYYDNKLYPDLSQVAVPGAELTVIINLQTAACSMARNCSKNQRLRSIFAVTRIDGTAYLLPDWNIGAWGGCTLPKAYNFGQSFGFAQWHGYSKEAIDVTNCPQINIVEVIGMDNFDKLSKDFKNKMRKLINGN